MADATTTVAELKQAMADFVRARDWEQFHSPKNLSMSLAVEAAELMEHFLWMDNAESQIGAFDAAARHAIGEEMADVTCLLLAMSNATGIDLSEAIAAKLLKNAVKYPAERFQGRYRIEKEGNH
jgi:NTP pyrophosphatase (non-canonical NTP hydrolase)